MLSAVTTIVAVVAWFELTDFAVVVISKSKVHDPATSKVTAAGSGDAMVIVAAVCPTEWLEPPGTVAYFTVIVYVV